MNLRLFRLSVLWLLVVSSPIANAQTIPLSVDTLIQQSRNQTAETNFEQAFATSAAAGQLAKKCCGENSVAYAAYCFNEGRIRYYQGQNKEALPWYVQARKLRGKILGTDHIEYGKSCNNLAIAYDLLARYEEAESLYLEALVIRKAKLGQESAPAAAVMANLGGMYSNMGEYEKAEALIQQALSIRKTLLGENDPQYAQSLVTLANHYYSIFNYKDVEALLLTAKEIYTSQEYLDFYSYVNVLQNLGALYQSLQDYEKAEASFTESATLVKDVLGENSLDYANSLNYLSRLAFETNDLSKSETLLRQQMGALEQLEYQEQENYGIALQYLSNILLEKGQKVEALAAMENAIAIFEKVMGTYHPRYLRGLWEKANILQALENYDGATAVMRRVASLEEKPLANAVKHLSDQELNTFTKNYRDYLSQSLALAAEVPELAGLCYNKLLLYKGFLLNNVISLRQRAQREEQTESLYRELRGFHRRLAKLYSQYNADPQEIQTLEDAAEQTEKALIRASAQTIELDFQLSWRDVQNQLGPTEASLELSAYQTFSTLGRPVATHYAALLILPGGDQPVFISLGTQAELDKLLQSETRADKKLLNELYRWPDRGQELYRLVWEPIAQTLDDYPEVKTIYYAGDGLLNRINLNAIPTSVDKVLAQRFNLRAFTSTRKLLQKDRLIDSTNTTALLYGSVDYGKVEGVSSSPDAPKSNANSRNRAYGKPLRGYNPDNGYWQTLPWTEVEVGYAQEVLQDAGYQATMKTGTEATEAHIKLQSRQSPSPRVIHLATHGYFFEPPPRQKTETLLPFEQAEESMIRSGLIMADGNFAWLNGRSRNPNQDDGILTALEVSQLELNETELVILSACETGLGDIQTTEGIFGLQRALELAGVQYMIISLWQVPDYQAQAFISSFYLSWLEEGKTIPEAFNIAQADIRAQYKEPFEWAGFILLE